MRGTPGRYHLDAATWRIIPAHAGNSVAAFATTPSIADHPRACGELAIWMAVSAPDAGSSPRMRGTRPSRWSRCASCRIIPAHAGNSREKYIRASLISDHPRACGELVDQFSARLSIGGSSPRMRGTLLSGHFREIPWRIIPAHAGNSSSRDSYTPLPPDHPRACGELRYVFKMLGRLRGSSPRMRGTRKLARDRSGKYRIIPAHAGNSLRLCHSIVF